MVGGIHTYMYQCGGVSMVILCNRGLNCLDILEDTKHLWFYFMTCMLASPTVRTVEMKIATYNENNLEP